jgi:hypothetical protein
MVMGYLVRPHCIWRAWRGEADEEPVVSQLSCSATSWGERRFRRRLAELTMRRWACWSRLAVVVPGLTATNKATEQGVTRRLVGAWGRPGQSAAIVSGELRRAGLCGSAAVNLLPSCALFGCHSTTVLRCQEWMMSWYLTSPRRI